MHCPVCTVLLQNKEYGNQVTAWCPSCQGVWLDSGNLHRVTNHLINEKQIDGLSVQEAFNRKVEPSDPGSRNERMCPRCSVKMQVVNYAYDSNVFLDKCEQCGGLWADKNEIEAIARFVKGNPVMDQYANAINVMRKKEDSLKQEAKEIEDLSEALMSNPGNPFSAWPVFPIPLKDEMPTVNFAKVTFVIIIVNFLVFGIQLFLNQVDSQLLFQRFGVIPNHGLAVDRWYTFITSMFLHAGVFHLLSNMFYLWLFGNNIEDRLGPIKFFAFYLMCGIVGSLVFCFMNPALKVPGIGASGAISGILGAYLVLFPKAELYVLWCARIRIIPAYFYLLLWFFLNVLYGFIALGINLHIAYWAHIGGFIAGVILMHYLKKHEMI